MAIDRFALPVLIGAVVETSAQQLVNSYKLEISYLLRARIAVAGKSLSGYVIARWSNLQCLADDDRFSRRGDLQGLMAAQDGG